MDIKRNGWSCQWLPVIASLSRARTSTQRPQRMAVDTQMESICGTAAVSGEVG